MFLFREDPAMRKAGLHWALIGMAVLSAQTLFAAKPLNILLITADDMNRNSVGIFDSQVPDATPNIDQLAAAGMRFEHAHVTIAVCQPCRNVWLTGRYSHCIGGEGFHNLRISNVPILPAVLRDAGYLVGLLGKVAHCTPYANFAWDIPATVPLGRVRNPQLYAKHPTFRTSRVGSFIFSRTASN